MNRQTINRLFERTFYGAIVGMMYAVLNLPWEWDLIIVCATIGLLIGLFTRLLDIWLYKTRLRRRRFLVVLIVRTFAYLMVISFTLMLVLGIYTAIDNRMGIFDVMRSRIFVGWIQGGSFVYIVFYSLVLLMVLQFITLVTRLLGPNVLINYLLGKYHQPKEEERIFMFIDLRSSTTIAERLGPMKWHQFLNDFFYDIGRPVRQSKGEIYQYVGDEVVISWPRKLGLENLNCINCFFWIWDRMESRKARYLKRYGYEPIFKAGYHIGKVVAGEIGDYKREIVFHGDAVNTASRIQVECNRHDRRLLLSDTLLKQLDLGDEYESEFITKIVLRGKKEEIGLYSLDLKPAQKEISEKASLST